MSGDRPFQKQLNRLRSKAKPAARLLLDLIESEIFPLLLGAGFRPCPECEKSHKNQFGLVWGANEFAFQDRTVSSWPTIELQVERSLEPYVKVMLCEIPQEPIMLDGTHLPREEANAAHCISLHLLRKGRSSSYKDQHFGAGWWVFGSERRVKQDMQLCREMISKVVGLPRSTFVASAVQHFGAKKLFQLWGESGPLRPNKSKV